MQLSLVEALKNPSVAKDISVDFSEGETIGPEIAELSNLQELHLRGCPEHPAIPNEIRQLTKLRVLRLSAKGDLVRIPKIFFELPIEHLKLWDAQIEDVLSFKHLNQLYFVTKDPKDTIEKLAVGLPHLTTLELWGSHLKTGELPANIEKLVDLLTLELISCGIKTLPPEFARLRNLKELAFRGLPMNEFPEVITELENLESLEFQQQVHQLPDSLAKLKKLKSLNLQGALNRGRMLGSEEETSTLKPIPDVISSLVTLENLNLSMCGVMNVDPLRPLQKLKTLNLKYGGFKVLTGLTELVNLEELNLETCYSIRDLRPLTRLPKLRVLSLQSDYISDISPVIEMAALESLDISSCRRITDFTAVFQHPTLKTLEANDKVVERWNKRHELNALPRPNAIRELLGNDTLADVEKGLHALAKYVDVNSSSETNALWSVFDLQSRDFDETEIVPIPELDAALEKHGSKLSASALADVVDATLRNIIENFGATLTAVERLVELKDIEGQKRVAAAFQRSCEHYDSGHRFWESTVLDQLIDELFPKFEAEPLAALLEPLGTDALNHESGDAMDRLFGPAFSRVLDAATEARLTKIFLKYLKDANSYFDATYWTELTGEIDASASDATKAALSQSMAEIAMRKQIEDDLESGDVARIDRRLREVGGTISTELATTLESAFQTAFRKAKPSFDAGLHYLAFTLETKQSHVANDVIVNLAQQDLPRLNEWLEQDAQKSDEHRNFVAACSKGALFRAVSQREPVVPEVHAAFRAMVAKLNGLSVDEVIALEMKRLLLQGVRQYDDNELNRVLEQLEQSAVSLSFVNDEYDGDTFASAVASHAENGNYAAVCRIGRLLPRIQLKNVHLQRVLAQVIACAQLGGEPETADAMIGLVPEELIWESLAYNLSCLYATRGNKAEMLKYIPKAIALGKPRTRFLGDSDFAAFLVDADFQQAISRG